jgi:hypothetical protein
MTPDLLEKFGKMEANIEEIMRILRDHDKRYAPYWVKYPVYIFCTGALTWTGQQMLSLVETVKSFF